VRNLNVPKLKLRSCSLNSICVGTRGEGKSTLALYLANQSHTAIVVFDPRGMFDGHIVYSAGELEEALDQEDYLDGQPIVYRFDHGDANQAFEEMARVLFPPQFTRGGFALIVDEAGDLQSSQSINLELRRAIAQHPTQGEMRVHMIQTSHRISEFNGKTKTCLDYIYQFRTNNPRDHQALVDFTDDPAIVEVVRELPPHHLVRYEFKRREDGGPQWEVWNDPGAWFAPIEVIPVEVRPSTGAIQ